MSIARKVKAIIRPSKLDDVLETVTEAACTEQPEDGKIFVCAVDPFANIRRKVRGVEAI